MNDVMLVTSFYQCERKQLSAHNKASAESHLTLVGESLAQWKRAFDTQTELLHQLTGGNITPFF